MHLWRSAVPRFLRFLSPLLSLAILATSTHAQLGMTNPVEPPDEPCSIQFDPNLPTGLLPSAYRWAPAAFLEGDPNNGAFTKPDEQDGRLHYFLRNMAQLAASTDTATNRRVLVDAVLLYLGLIKPTVNVSWPGASWNSTINADPKAVATAVAQLAVTGRRAYASFSSWHPPASPPTNFAGPTDPHSGPQDADLVQLVQETNPMINQKALLQAVDFVLNESYSVLWAIRANDPTWRARRAQMGWIAVSGEDDTPHRPVNVPTAPYPQYDLPVAVSGPYGTITAVTRYMVASYTNFIGPDTPPPYFPPPPQASSGSNSGSKLQSSGVLAGTGISGQNQTGITAQMVAPVRQLPVDGMPAIPPGNKIIIYIHGGGSRLEEAVPLANNLILEGMRPGSKIGIGNQNYTVISFDLPNSAYGEPFDPAMVYGSTYHPSIFNILKFEEQYVINFIEALDQKVGNIKKRVAAVMGGSLGGNMSLLLARESAQVHPYLKAIVAWSPTSMMPSPKLLGSGDLGKGVVKSGNLSGANWEAEGPNTRGSYFHHLYFEMLSKIANLPSDPEMWYRNGWPNKDGSDTCKMSNIAQSRFDRYEVYSSPLRRWTTAIDTEQAMYSFQDEDSPGNGPRYQQIASRLLLVAGEKDCYRNGCRGINDPRSALLADTLDIYGYTHDVANKMGSTPGRTLFIKNTGHSIHTERPIFFAQEIVDFLKTPDKTLQVNLGAGDSGLRWNSQVSALFMTKDNQRMLVNIDLNTMLHPWPAFVISPDNPCGVCGELHHFQFPPDSQHVFAVDFSRTGFNLADIQALAIQFTGGSRGPTDSPDHFDLTAVTLAALNLGGVIGPLGTGIMFSGTGSGSAPAGQPLKSLQSPQDLWETTSITLPQPPLPSFSANLSSGTDANGPYVYISNRPNEPPQVNNYWTQVPTWIQVNAVDGSNNPVQGSVEVLPAPPPYWPFAGSLAEGIEFGVVSKGYDAGRAEPTGRKIYFTCLPAGTPISGASARPSNLRSFPGNQQGCWLQVSAPGYVSCVLQLGQVLTASGGVLGGLLGGGGSVAAPGQPCPAAPSISLSTPKGTPLTAPNTTNTGLLSGGPISNTGNRAGQMLAAQWTLSAAVCPTADGKTCISITARPPNSPLMDLVTVTSVGAPVAGATVTVSGQPTNTVPTNANGLAVITHLPCYAPGSQVPQVGQTRVPVRTPVPCAATASMAGYQPYSFSLP